MHSEHALPHVPLGRCAQQVQSQGLQRRSAEDRLGFVGGRPVALLSVALFARPFTFKHFLREDRLLQAQVLADTLVCWLTP